MATGKTNGGGTKLYGLDPATGQARYTEQLPSPVADHFASPSAAGGRLLVATGSTVSAHQIAVLTPEPSSPAPIGVSPVATPVDRAAAQPALLSARLHAGPKGFVQVPLRCPVGTNGCSGTLTIWATLSAFAGHGSHRHRVTVRVRMIRVAFASHKPQFTLRLHLGSRARALLRRHHGRLHVTSRSPHAATPHAKSTRC